MRNKSETKEFLTIVAVIFKNDIPLEFLGLENEVFIYNNIIDLVKFLTGEEETALNSDKNILSDCLDYIKTNTDEMEYLNKELDVFLKNNSKINTNNIQDYKETITFKPFEDWDVFKTLKNNRRRIDKELEMEKEEEEQLEKEMEKEFIKIDYTKHKTFHGFSMN